MAVELASEGVSVRELFARNGVDAAQLEDAHARISHRQRIAIYRNAKTLAKRPDIGLLADARQRISDYGIYGYAMVSSPTFGDALLFSLDHVTMAGPAVKQISFRVDGGTRILRSHGLDDLGNGSSSAANSADCEPGGAPSPGTMRLNSRRLDPTLYI